MIYDDIEKNKAERKDEQGGNNKDRHVLADEKGQKK
jgi:hypothetical protein